MQALVNVVCMKWGVAYGPHYVNRLYAMVARHLSAPFRFRCFTDDPCGLNAAIEPRPLPELALSPDLHDQRWRKLGVFRALEGESGPVLFLDLDLVVVRSLDPFLEVPGEFLAVRDAELFPYKLSYRFRPQRAARYRITGNSSVLRFTAGAHTDLTEAFERNAPRIMSAFRNEQEFISQRLWRQEKLEYWPTGWCVSFKRHCIAPGLRSWVSNPRLPAHAKIVLFAGNIKPHQVVEGTAGKWYRHVGPTPWLASHWC